MDDEALAERVRLRHQSRERPREVRSGPERAAGGLDLRERRLAMQIGGTEILLRRAVILDDRHDLARGLEADVRAEDVPGRYPAREQLLGLARRHECVEAVLAKRGDLERARVAAEAPLAGSCLVVRVPARAHKGIRLIFD